MWEENQFYTDAVMWASIKMNNRLGKIPGWMIAMEKKGGLDQLTKLTREQLVTMLYRYWKVKKACLKIAFRKMYSTICGIFGSNKGGVAGYADRIRAFAREAMSWAVAEQLVTGDQGLINPQGIRCV